MKETLHEHFSIIKESKKKINANIIELRDGIMHKTELIQLFLFHCTE